MSITRTALLTLLSSAFLSACAVGPDYKAPTIGLPAAFSNKNNATSALPAEEQQNVARLSQWWTYFADPTLDQLVAKALSGNHSLQAAQARIDEARGIRRTAFGVLWPQIGASADAARSKGNTVAGSGTRNTRQAGFDASWELDLFGGNRRNLEASDATLLGVIAETDNASLSLAAEVAVQYIEYRTIQRQLNLARDSVKTQDEILQLTKDLFEAELTSGLEVSQAESVVRSTAAQVPVYERQLEATRQALAVLTGTTADELPMDALNKTSPVPMAKALPFLEAPTTVLARRPDVIAAERTLAANTALTGVEMAQLYPKLSLSGLFGVGGGTGINNASVWSVAANAAMPLLNFGTIQGRIDAQEARQQQAYHLYRQTVLEAVADVETSLSGLAYETQHRAALSKAVDSNQETLRLARARYENGLTAFIDVLQAQQSLYGVQQEFVRSEADQAQALVAVYKSLGVAPRNYGTRDDD